LAAPPEPGEALLLNCVMAPKHLLVLVHGQALLLPVREARGAGGPPEALHALFYMQAADHTMQELELLALQGSLAPTCRQASRQPSGRCWPRSSRSCILWSAACA